MKTVDQLVSEWTEEERENLKDLIEECREREKRISESSKSSRENLSRISESLGSFISNLHKFKEKSEKLENDLLGIYLHFNRRGMASA